ncbi:acylphosphatase [Anaerosacchariphilus polymeriproducens]|uniref:acylphosphatase n=2 Tax=Anaerosacchariphilus polymeriproducens TaxID=1812858 RepID=A0A371AVH1_9FIRM|nr:acylphosphatase [Anaerosacchariphilus polymeriproducens]
MFWGKFKDFLLIGKSETINLPIFSETKIIRKSISFEGQVQNVGFRMETKLLAEKLGLTGKAINLYDGTVFVELQGTQEKIDFLITCLYQVRRIEITNYTINDLPLVEDEVSFIIR